MRRVIIYYLNNCICQLSILHEMCNSSREMQRKAFKEVVLLLQPAHLTLPSAASNPYTTLIHTNHHDAHRSTTSFLVPTSTLCLKIHSSQPSPWSLGIFVSAVSSLLA